MSIPRLMSYDHIARKLAAMSEAELASLTGKPFHEGIGGTSEIISIDDTHVFVKQVPLTDRERLPENIHSTANIFNLPSYYQYGVGSTGFGSWRELEAHKITTDWALSGKCPNFPLMYHWRVIEKEPQTISPEIYEATQKDVAYWENSEAVRDRLQAINKCSAHIYLFLECIPQAPQDWQNLYGWLQIQIKAGGLQAAEAIQMVESTLFRIAAFMKAHGFIHFDLHFWNILTDGETLYISDFGLAQSASFQLSEEEKQFFESHKNYDAHSISVNLLHCIITALYGQENWIENLKGCLESNCKGMQPEIREVIQNHAQVALVMDQFYMSLQKVSKLTPFPYEAKA